MTNFDVMVVVRYTTGRQSNIACCKVSSWIQDDQNKKLSYCWETVRRESMPRIAEMDVEMTT